MEDDAAHHLDVVVALFEGPFPGLADDGVDLDQLGVEDFLDPAATFLHLFRKGRNRLADPDFDRGKALPEGVVREGSHLGLEVGNGGNAGLKRLDVAVMLRSEDLGEGFVDDHEGFSAHPVRETVMLAERF